MAVSVCSRRMGSWQPLLSAFGLQSCSFTYCKDRQTRNRVWLSWSDRGLEKLRDASRGPAPLTYLCGKLARTASSAFSPSRGLSQLLTLLRLLRGLPHFVIVTQPNLL